MFADNQDSVELQPIDQNKIEIESNQQINNNRGLFQEGEENAVERS